jgi:hypothetical protein
MEKDAIRFRGDLPASLPAGSGIEAVIREKQGHACVLTARRAGG